MGNRPNSPNKYSHDTCWERHQSFVASMVLLCTPVCDIYRLVYAKTSYKMWLLRKHACSASPRFRPLCAWPRSEAIRIGVELNPTVESLRRVCGHRGKCSKSHQPAANKKQHSSQQIAQNAVDPLSTKWVPVYLLVFWCKFKFYIWIIFGCVTVHK